MASIRIGISGWRYPPWRGTFYPKDLAQKDELSYAASKLPIIEINGSFYSLQRPSSYAQWYGQTPKNFIFSVKGPRYITHMRKLRDVQAPLANFLASGVFALKEKLGPILWQFPPSLRYDEQKFADFFEMLPHDTAAAARFARDHHDAWLKKRSLVEIDKKRRLRHVIEIRHESFLVESFIALLRKHGIALVIAETAKKWPMPQDVTADFIYMRLHGDKEIYKSAYGDKALDRWAKRIEAWHRGAEPKDAKRVSKKAAPRKGQSKNAGKRKARDIYCFFDNTDVKLRAPFDAQRLMSKLGVAYRPRGGSAPAAKTAKRNLKNQ